MNKKRTIIFGVIVSSVITIAVIQLFAGNLHFYPKEHAVKEKNYGDRATTPRTKHTGQKEYITNFAKLTADFYDIGIHELWNMTGPLELLSDNEFLLIAKCGEVFLLKLTDKSRLLESRQIGHLKNVTCIDNFKWGIVKDSEIIDGFLLVSYLEKIDETYRLVLDKIRRTGNLFDFESPERIFESKPNVPLKQGVHNHTYGRIAKKNENEIFFVIADFGAQHYIDDDSSTLGKLFLVNIDTGVSSLIAKGFRSPGGIYYDKDNDLLWESEHGPIGGDEVNLVKEGENYGWPHVSYGRGKQNNTPYGFNHEGYEKPKHVFVPSVATSGIIQYPHDGEIIKWQGDLILGTLREKMLYRLKVDKETIIYAEPIANIGSRIRDIKIGNNSKIYLKTDNSELIIIKAEALADDQVIEQLPE